ncbi:symporter small accessory protein [Anaerobacterium chartisolvens]|uniref:symporter small accessory protein n=1 Tax=Anaerobacterium chartisolvens TaxID=1297424 RepID=UPI000DF2B88B|nr:symporter small accessory protein [Anaerobacterium chartisolvens]
MFVGLRVCVRVPLLTWKQFCVKRGESMFLGIPDSGIWSAYILCILSALACVIYGLYNWNKESD